MAKKNIMAKVFAYLALFGIVLGIVGTGMLFIFGNSSNQSSNNQQVKTLTSEKIKEMIKSGKIKVESKTGVTTK